MSDTIFNQAGQTVGTQYNIGGTKLSGSKEEKLNLYKFNVQGILQGLFIASGQELNSVIGKKVLFGKSWHDMLIDFDNIMRQDYFTVVTDDAHTITTLWESAGCKTICGQNPFMHSFRGRWDDGR